MALHKTHHSHRKYPLSIFFLLFLLFPIKRLVRLFLFNIKRSLSWRYIHIHIYIYTICLSLHNLLEMLYLWSRNLTFQKAQALDLPVSLAQRRNSAVASGWSKRGWVGLLLGLHMSEEKRAPGCLGFVGDSNLLLWYMGTMINHSKDLY